MFFSHIPRRGSGLVVKVVASAIAKGSVEQSSRGAGEERLAATRRAEQQDIALPRSPLRRTPPGCTRDRPPFGRGRPEAGAQAFVSGCRPPRRGRRWRSPGESHARPERAFGFPLDDSRLTAACRAPASGSGPPHRRIPRELRSSIDGPLHKHVSAQIWNARGASKIILAGVTSFGAVAAERCRKVISYGFSHKRRRCEA